MTQSIFNQRIDTGAGVNYVSVNGVYRWNSKSAVSTDILQYNVGVDLVKVSLDATNKQLTFTNDTSSTNAIALSMKNKSSVGGVIQKPRNSTSVAKNSTVFFTEDFLTTLLQQLFNDGDTQQVIMKVDNGTIKSQIYVDLFFNGTEYNWKAEAVDI